MTESSRGKYILYGFLFLLAIIAPIVLTNEYTRHLFVLTLIFSIFGLSYDLTIGGMGQVSLGHQAFFGLGAYIAGLLSERLQVPVWFCLPAAVAGAGILGLFLGYVSLRTRGAYLAIVMLGFAMILWMITMGWRDVTYGQAGVRGIPSPSIALPLLPEIKFDSPLSYYYLSLALLLFVMYFISRLKQSRFGRAIAGIRENEDRAILLGINVFAHLLMMFTIAAMVAGVAGFAYAHYISFIDPKVLSVYYMSMGLIMVIVGGSGTLFGPIFGAFVFFFVPEWLRIAEDVRLVFFGIVLVTFIILMPEGIYPRLVMFWHRLIYSDRVGKE
jgi:branched-chain amino acid transport system permease protein